MEEKLRTLCKKKKYFLFPHPVVFVRVRSIQTIKLTKLSGVGAVKLFVFVTYGWTKKLEWSLTSFLANLEGQMSLPEWSTLRWSL